MSKYLEESYNALLKENSELIEQHKKALNEVERLKGALEKILDHGDDRPDCYPLYNIAEESLKELK